MSREKTVKARQKARDKVRELKERALARDPVARELVRSGEDASANSRLPMPSTNPVTNLVIAELVVRSASSMFRENVERRVARAGFGSDEKAREVLDGRTIVTSLALYGASKLARRSPVGLALVAGGLVVKTLYDRGKTRQQRKLVEVQPAKQADD